MENLNTQNSAYLKRQEHKTAVRCLFTLGGSLCYEMLKTLLFPCYLQGLPFRYVLFYIFKNFLHFFV